MHLVPLLLCCFLVKHGATEDEGYIKTIEVFDTIQKDTDDDRIHDNSTALITVFHLEDPHKQLLIYWDSEVIIFLARNPTSTTSLHPSGPSAVYTSYDNAHIFATATNMFKLSRGNYANLNTFYNHPKFKTHFVFTDVEHNVIFTTMNQCHDVEKITLSIFTPSHVSFHEYRPSVFVVLDKTNTLSQTLWVTEDFGHSFRLLMQENVKAFSWVKINDSSLALVVQREDFNGYNAVLYSTDLFSNESVMVQNDTEDYFYVKGDYLFTTKLSANESLDLYVSYKLGKTIKCVFDTELEIKGYFIVDIADNKALVAVSHSDITSHLYVSENLETDVVEFTLSLKNVFCYFPNSTWHQTWIHRVSENPFADVYKVEGLSGIYIASRVLLKYQNKNLSPQHLGSVITFDHGRSWRLIEAPKHDSDGYSCSSEDGCSLHLGQKFNQLYRDTRSMSILSSKSAPGLIMATGVLGRSLQGRPGIYISNDGGFTWRQTLKDLHFYNMGDHGGVLTAVNYFDSTSVGKRKHILYSTDEGHNWHKATLAQDINLYGMVTQPGEKNTDFLLFGSLPRLHQWIIFKINLKDVFQTNCTKSDYENWFPNQSNGTISNISSTSEKQISFKRRIPQTNCHNGFYFDARAPIDFDNTTNSSTKNQDFMIFAEKQKIHLLNLKTRNVETLVTNLTKAVAIEFDTKNSCVYWTDIEPQTLSRFCLNSNESEVLVLGGLGRIEGLALDWISNNMYFVNSEERKIELIKIEVDHSKQIRRRILGPDVLTKPRGIAVHPQAGYMFWTDWSWENASISRADLDGSNVKKLVGRPRVNMPNGVTVDYAGGRIYWVDARKGCLASSDFNGNDFKKVVSEWHGIGHPFSVAVFGSKVYWSDWTRSSILVADKDEFRGFEVVSNLTTTPMDLKIYARGGRVGSNSCSNTTCAYICVGTPIKHRSSCLCPDDVNTTVTNSTAEQTCGGDNFTCDDGLSLPKSWWCDGENDCYDSSDEVNCNKTLCPPNSFQCTDGNCVDYSFRCDYDKDCWDGSDEKDCPQKNCTAYEFACASGQCITARWRCDGPKHCWDGSDELNCTEEMCRSNQFRCHSGRNRCIPNIWQCDEYKDCYDGSDEVNCTDELNFTEEMCQSKEFKCHSGRVNCIPNFWYCDGDKDCYDGSDEVNCSRKPCRYGEFECDDSNCIKPSRVCDGHQDCSNGRDEMICTTTTPKLVNIIDILKPQKQTCYDWMFKCANQKCIPRWWKCDGANDCGDGSDEVACFTRTAGCNGQSGCSNNESETDSNVTAPKLDPIASLKGKLIEENDTSVELTWTVTEAGNTTSKTATAPSTPPTITTACDDQSGCSKNEGESQVVKSEMEANVTLSGSDF